MSVRLRGLLLALMVFAACTPTSSPPDPTCTDGAQNGDETDVDCGGTCGQCLGESCAAATECASEYCAASICSACTETSQCASGKACVSGTCGACTLNSQCGAGTRCFQGACEPLTPLPPTVYVHNFLAGGNTIAAYSISATGALTAVPGSPFPLNAASAGWSGDARALALDKNHHLFASANNRVAVFDVNAQTGALTPVAGSPFSTGGLGGFGLGLDNANHLFLANCNFGGPGQSVSVFDIAENGALTPVAGSPFPVPGTTCPDSVAVTPDGKFAYVGTESDNVHGFAIGPTGALTALAGSPFAYPVASSGTSSLQLNKEGTLLFVPDYTASTFSVFQVNVTTGALTFAPGSPQTPAIPGVEGLALTPDGTRVYYGGTASICGADAVAADGTLTPLTGAPFSLPTTANSVLEVTQDGFLIVADQIQRNLRVFSLSAAGAPTEVAGSPYVPTSDNTSAGPASLLVTP